jgi:hypothetical protein
MTVAANRELATRLRDQADDIMTRHAEARLRIAAVMRSAPGCGH